MPQAKSARSRAGRRATRLGLRALAALVALLLFGSALGQVAHFAFVQHAVCAEHGELVELHQGDSHGASTASEAPHADHEQSSDEDPGGDHDHCQLLAPGPREQAVPAAPAVGVLPATTTAFVSAPTLTLHLELVEPPLSLAPKTSPPRHAAVG